MYMPGIVRRIFRQDVLIALALLLVAALFCERYTTSRLSGDAIGGWEMTYSVMRESLLTHGVLHFWTHHLSGGAPMFSVPEFAFMDPSYFIAILMADRFLALQFVLCMYMAAAGIGMYLFVRHLEGSSSAALIAGLIYMLSGFVSGQVSIYSPPHLIPVAYLPFAMLFVARAFESELHKELVSNAIVAGMIMSLMILAGGSQMFLWSSLLIAMYLGFQWLLGWSAGKNPGALLVKIVVLATVLFGICLGISAIRLLPGLEFSSATNRSSGLDYQEFLWPFSLVKPIDMVPALFVGLGNSSLLKIGIAGSLLAIVGLLDWRKKRIAIYAAICIIAGIILADTFATKLLYNYVPGFNRTRALIYGSILIVFSLCILAARGTALLLARFRSSSRAAVVIILAAAIILQLLFLSAKPDQKKDLGAELTNAYALQSIANETGHFRVHYYGFDFVSSPGNFYLAPMGLEIMEWNSAHMWYTPYLQYTTIAGNLAKEGGQKAASKMWGMLNVKYILAKEPINVTGLELVKRFPDCATCFSNDPYLYRNSLFLDRAILAENAVIVLGEEEAATGLMYGIIQLDSFDPNTTVLLRATQLSSFDDEVIKKAGLILITSQPSQEDIYRIQGFVSRGGHVLPDITAGKASLTENDIVTALNNFSSVPHTVRIIEYEPNNMAVETDMPGFVLMNEKLTAFPGWTATADGTPVRLYEANMVSAVVYMPRPGTIRYSYMPPSFIPSLIISLGTVLVAGAALIILKQKKNKLDSQEPGI